MKYTECTFAHELASLNLLDIYTFDAMNAADACNAEYLPLSPTCSVIRCAPPILSLTRHAGSLASRQGKWVQLASHSQPHVYAALTGIESERLLSASHDGNTSRAQQHGLVWKLWIATPGKLSPQYVRTSMPAVCGMAELTMHTL